MSDVFAVAERLERAGESFVIATVVRAERPTSAKAGDKAVFTERGLIEGWIGGSCAEPTVAREAQAALVDGECRLLHLSPAPEVQGGREGLKFVPISCYSGGTLEIYLEPHRAAPLLAVYGHSPVASAVASLGRVLKYRVTVFDLRRDQPEADGVVRDLSKRSDFHPAFAVVATHGVFDEDALEHAMASGAAYVGLVASKRRAESVRAVLESKGVPAGRVRSPAGLDLGARTPEEIALSILAEVVATQRASARPTPERVAPQQHSCCASEGGVRDLSAILLAAGESRRMGGVNKLLLSIGGLPLVRRSAAALIASGIEQPIVVVGFEAERVRAALTDLPVRLVMNDAFRDGQETSVRAGLAAIPADIAGVMICLADQPALTAADLREIQTAFRTRARGSALVPTFRGQRGNPIVLDPSGLEAILARGGKFGCRQFTTHHADLVETYEMSTDHVTRDLDRPEDLATFSEAEALASTSH